MISFELITRIFIACKCLISPDIKGTYNVVGSAELLMQLYKLSGNCFTTIVMPTTVELSILTDATLVSTEGNKTCPIVTNSLKNQLMSHIQLT